MHLSARVLLGACGALALLVSVTIPAAELSRPTPEVLEQIRLRLENGMPHPPSAQALAELGSSGDFASQLRAIDPYAEWFPAGRSDPVGERSGWWSGIGADVSFEADGVRLLPYQGGPAAAAGIPDRARLVAIDGQALRSLSPDALAEQLRGKAGSMVRLTLVDENGNSETISVRRQWVRPLDVELIGTNGRQVIRLREFLGGLSRSALLATFSFLRDNPAAKADQQLVIDLRYNPGGDLFEAFDLAGLFVPAGTVLGSLVTRAGQPREVLAPAGEKIEETPILLVGPNTASAAEIFAGTLQQLGQARLIGQPTFGKCSSQTSIGLSDGSVLRYTNLEVLLPDLATCTGIGLDPDFVLDGDSNDDLNALIEAVRTPTGFSIEQDQPGEY
ncbi:MAG: carboxyl-terminal protease [Wenzhouxiangellaceae bacterium]|nr:MAG: carboxyl-terminal protease [Wenzhouxiangellaceae bacterium]